ncbi:MAG: hypothetical protein ABIW79_10460 [Gemmatimonas sp.]
MRHSVLGCCIAFASLAAACADKPPTEFALLPDGLWPRTDTMPGAPIGAAKFSLVARVTALVPPSDSITRVTALVPGAKVTLTLLELRPGDSVAPNATRMTREWELAPVVADSSGLVRFYNLDVTRYRLRIDPPAGSPFGATVVESAPPRYASVVVDLSLRTP